MVCMHHGVMHDGSGEIRFVGQAGAASQHVLMKLMPQWQPALLLQPLLMGPPKAFARQRALFYVKMLLRLDCCGKAPFIARLLVALDRRMYPPHCSQSRMAHAIIARVQTGLCKDALAAHASFHAAYPRTIIHDGYQYKTLADHDPHSTDCVNEIGKLRALDPAWRICPCTPATVRVCAAYPWQAYTLVFADGSAVGTSEYNPGMSVVKSRALYKDSDGRYEATSRFITDQGKLLKCDVFIRRKL